MRELPHALTKVFKIAPSARENIGHVLNSSFLVIDELLEQGGIAKVPGLEPPPRRVVEDMNGAELGFGDDGTTSTTVRGQGHASLRRQQDGVAVEVDFALPYTSLPSPGLSDASGGGPRILEPLGTPSSSASGEGNVRASPHEATRPSRTPSPIPPERIEVYSDNAYLELLNNVIRIAHRSTLPHHNESAGIGNGQFHQGFDHDSAFGVRSQGQMNHDVKIGAAGELFVGTMNPIALPYLL
jgi:hypothetical protein